MAVEFSLRQKEGITIVDLHGRLILGESATRLRTQIRSLIDEGKSKLILNLADVDYIDSTGLGTLVVCYTSLQKAGGQLKLLNLNRRNVELLVLTKLFTIFELFNDEQDAVNSFFADRQIHRFDVLDFVREQRRDED
ncbi:MAG: STAS domain-containing protein [Bryobacterales bacterium]|nr:STAS domain-containing protein [Bryobacterales bacterium]